MLPYSTDGLPQTSRRTATPSGLYVFHDSGSPRRAIDHVYTTVVIIHGSAWHSAIFSHLRLYAREANARIVLVNRRDYQGARDYDDADLALLSIAAAEDSDSDPDPGADDDSDIVDLEAREASVLPLEFFMKHRAHELLRFLVDLVATEHLPRAGPDSGGIVLVGCALGVLWPIALLAHAPSFLHQGVDLNSYLRRIVLYEGPSFAYGYPRPADAYNPLLSRTPRPTDTRVHDWLSGYFAHGRTPATLERHTPLRSPPPTLRALSASEHKAVVWPYPAERGGSDYLLARGALKTGLFKDLWAAALYLDRGAGAGTAGALHGVEVRVMWCERSVWETTHAAWAIRDELAAAAGAGGRRESERERERGREKEPRRVTFARVRGANHFAHWAEPEKVLHAFLADESEVEG